MIHVEAEPEWLRRLKRTPHSTPGSSPTNVQENGSNEAQLQLMTIKRSAGVTP